MKQTELTFATTIELHLDLLVHILAQIKDILLLGLLLLGVTTASFLLLATATTTSTATAAERASFRHWEGGGSESGERDKWERRKSKEVLGWIGRGWYCAELGPAKSRARITGSVYGEWWMSLAGW